MLCMINLFFTATLLGLALLAGPAPAADVPQTQLQLWLRPDRLESLAPNARILKWSDASPAGNHAVAVTEAHAPVVARHQALGVNVARFRGNLEDGVVHALRLPFEQTWEELTLIAVGDELALPGLLDTAPGADGCFRLMGWAQLCGSSLAMEVPFAGVSGPGLIAVRISRDERRHATLATYVNGREVAVLTQPTAEEPAIAILFRTANIGANNLHGSTAETAFAGDVAELLLYSRALSDGELAEVMRALAQKYNLPAAAKP